jgi:DnaJ homolog subfamily C member 19
MIKIAILAGLGYLIFLFAKQAVKSTGKMSVGDAAKVLDVATDASPETILEAHRRLIAKVHPDAGGTSELAARVNQARDTLLQRIGR